MKTLQLLICLLLTQVIVAQETFFQTLEKNGEDAIYQEYYSVSKDDKGKQKINGKRYEVTVKPIRYKGMKVGFNMVKVEDGKNFAEFNPTKDSYKELVGYPNTSHLIHTYKSSGFVAIGDYIFELTRITDDGLSFSGIDAIYIKKGSAGKKEEEKGEKKKKKGKFFKKLGKAALKVATNGRVSNVKTASPEAKKAMSIDLNQMVKDYLKQMKTKQESYELTSQDHADITMLRQSAIDHKAYVKRYNDSVYNTPEYQRIRENNRRANNAGKRNNVTLINNTGQDLLIINSETNTSTMSLGSVSKTWMCSRNAYIGRKVSDGSVIRYKIIRKVYSANSKCGGTVTIN